MRKWREGTAVAVAGLCAVGISVSVHAASFTSVADGNWTSDATWSGTGTPGSGDTATVAGQHDITVSSDEVFSGGGFTDYSAGGAVEIIINAGQTLTLDSGVFDVDIPTDGARISGDGTFINSASATVEVSNTGEFLFDVLTPSARAVFLNYGAIELSGTDAEFELFYGVLTNLSGGVIRRTPSGVGSMGHHTGASSPTFTALSGSIFEAVDAGGELRFEMRDIVNDPVGRATDVTFKGAGRISFEGYWTEISGTITESVTVELNSGTADGHFSLADGTVYNVTGSATGLLWSGTAGHYILSTGQSVTNKGTFTNGRGQGQMNGPGEFVNAAGATFRFDSQHASQRNMFIAVQNKGGGTDTTFRNLGTFDIVGENTHSIFMHTLGGTFQNESTGVIRKDTAGKADFADVSANGDFNNLGTVEVTQGEIEISTGLATTSFTSSDFNEGSWHAYGSGILDLTTVGGVSAGSLNTIGASAAVRLGGTATFTQFTTSSLTVNGTFGVRDQFIKTLSGSLTMGGGGTLEFALEAADAGGTLVTGIDITGNIDFAGATVDIIDLGDMTTGTYRLIEFGTKSGANLVLGSTPAGGFTYQLLHNADNVELVVAGAPGGTVVSLQ